MMECKFNRKIMKRKTKGKKGTRFEPTTFNMIAQRSNPGSISTTWHFITRNKNLFAKPIFKIKQLFYLLQTEIQ